MREVIGASPVSSNEFPHFLFNSLFFNVQTCKLEFTGFMIKVV